MSAPIGVGVIGLGFMGRTHVKAYAGACAAGWPCELRAVCDPSAERRSGAPEKTGNIGAAPPERLFDPSTVRGYERPEDLLADPSVSLVSICTYTDSHVDLAIAALAAGKHVLVEKPVALASAQAERLAKAAATSKGLCMPAMCMRFWPGWDWLRARIRDGTYGRIKSLTFTRMGSGPTWSSEFYRDASRSGGALFDLHIHDADFITWCFGAPAAVTSAGSAQHVTTLYHFEDGPVHVAAEGAWDLAPSSGFRMRYLATFERATAEWDISRTPNLAIHLGDGSQTVDLGALLGYDGQARHLLEAIASGKRELNATVESAVQVIHVLEAEARSLQSRRTESVQAVGRAG